MATIRRLPKNTGLFCKRALLKRLYSAKETYVFKKPTNHSHPIDTARDLAFLVGGHSRERAAVVVVWVCAILVFVPPAVGVCVCVCVCVCVRERYRERERARERAVLSLVLRVVGVCVRERVRDSEGEREKERACGREKDKEKKPVVRREDCVVMRPGVVPHPNTLHRTLALA